MHDSGQNLTITPVGPGLSLRLKLSIKFQQLRVFDLLAMCGKYGTEGIQNACFPVNESSIAVKGQELEAG